MGVQGAPVSSGPLYCAVNYVAKVAHFYKFTQIHFISYFKWTNFMLHKLTLNRVFYKENQLNIFRRYFAFLHLITDMLTVGMNHSREWRSPGKSWLDPHTGRLKSPGGGGGGRHVTMTDFVLCDILCSDK